VFLFKQVLICHENILHCVLVCVHLTVSLGVILVVSISNSQNFCSGFNRL